MAVSMAQIAAARVDEWNRQAKDGGDLQEKIRDSFSEESSAINLYAEMLTDDMARPLVKTTVVACILGLIAKLPDNNTEKLKTLGLLTDIDDQTREKAVKNLEKANKVSVKYKEPSLAPEQLAHISATIMVSK